jgi:hypothetical protein
MEAIEKGIGGSGARAATRSAKKRNIFKMGDRQVAHLDNGSDGEKTPARSERAGEVGEGQTAGDNGPVCQGNGLAGPDDPDPTPHAAPINREQVDVDDVKRFIDPRHRYA